MSGAVKTIGELARLSGVSVRRIRFYSDKGLLQPMSRTRGGYRVYTVADVARLDLIRALRAAGASIASIRKTLSRRFSLPELLQMRLRMLEAEIASRQRVAAVLRATLQAPQPTEADLVRLWNIVTLSKPRLREIVADFVAKVTDGFPVNEAWKGRMVAANVPDLPDDPTSEQVDAWIEIVKMYTDEALISEMRAEMTAVWHDGINLSAFTAASRELQAAARKAISKGIKPTSAAASAIAHGWLKNLARIMKRELDETFIAWARKRQARNLRLYQLRAVLERNQGSASSSREWLWVNEALHL
ncbi:MAG TPA: MerR family transcriptional regulator [Steroidobacteraceae bacterium]|nr:MerR family transcriptional regulator [Steroidobacteraceae bacterium]